MKSPVPYFNDAEYTALPVQERALQFASAQVGRREIGKNAGPFVSKILASVGLGPGFPWCTLGLGVVFAFAMSNTRHGFRLSFLGEGKMLCVRC